MRGSACGPSEAPEGSAPKARRRAKARGGGAPRAVIDVRGSKNEMRSAGALADPRPHQRGLATVAARQGAWSLLTQDLRVERLVLRHDKVATESLPHRAAAV